ncbi:MAG: hypothetical protein JXO51_10955 [Candidatus Aminicenantes bacterium]|nr:hypothetical protein [Candidatus Aminicenantes bacterium]
MKRRIAPWLCACVLLLSLAGCNFFGIPEYELTVTVEPGVTGTPASGVYAYTELDQVEYAYTPVDSRHTVQVLVDGGPEDPADTLTIYRSMTLLARLFDVRGSWKVTFYVTESTAGNEFTITFSGEDILGGTFSDDRGYHGTWDAVDGKLNFVFSDLGQYKYAGELADMAGTWSNGDVTGSWSAVRAD